MEQKRKGCFYRLMAAAVLILSAVWISACSSGTQGESRRSQSSSVEAHSSDNLSVDFIDVGQGDSALIGQSGHYMLIDAGERDQADTVISYLKSQGVKRLDYVIGTHPHSDHIGGLAEVIEEFEIGAVILPGKEHTTKTYERLLTAIEGKGLKITVPRAGDQFAIGSSSFQILSPGRDYEEDLNNWSVGLRLDYQDTSFVLCGDAEKTAEADMCASGLDLKADVLKLSHHGSGTSSSQEFMDQVDPEYGVISCGKNNDYGHPHKETMELLQSRGVKVYRTDLQGTIRAVSDGKKVVFEEGPENTAVPKPEASEKQYVINENTKKFHLPECKSVTAMKEENRRYESKSREELINMGYEPCKSCNP